MPRTPSPVAKRSTKAQRAKAQRVKVRSRNAVAVCGQPTLSGTLCEQKAGHGTDHPGYGRCRLHGGLTRSDKASAASRQAAVMGSPLNVTPTDAILWVVQISAGEVAYASAQIAELESPIARPHEIVDRPQSQGKDGESSMTRVQEHRYGPETLHLWIKVRHDAMERLARFSKMAIDCELTERQVRLSEQLGQQLSTAIGTILTGLGLTLEQQAKAPSLVRAALEQMGKAQGGAQSVMPAIPEGVVEGSLAGGVESGVAA